MTHINPIEFLPLSIYLDDYYSKNNPDLLATIRSFDDVEATLTTIREQHDFTDQLVGLRLTNNYSAKSALFIDIYRLQAERKQLNLANATSQLHDTAIWKSNKELEVIWSDKTNSTLSTRLDATEQFVKNALIKQQLLQLLTPIATNNEDISIG